jgi:ornithine cyclodeaminase
VIVLNDPDTRLPLAIMEGGLISAMRTAVVQALAARYLARPDSTVLGLVGAGRIGALSVWAICQWFPDLRDIRVFDLSEARAEACCQHLQKLGLAATTVSNFEAALAPADIALNGYNGLRALGYPRLFQIRFSISQCISHGSCV